MTFQQLEYIIAVDKYRHFVNAATACGVKQSTLSTTIAKFEEEIDVEIFDRTKHPIEPTPMGRRIIQQANVILHNSSLLRDLVTSEKEGDRGKLFIGMVPSVAPSIYPKMAQKLKLSCPKLETHLYEEETQQLIDKLQNSELDMAFMASTDVTDTNLLQVPLFTERFVAYVSPASPLHSHEWLRAEDLHDGDIRTLRTFHDRYPQLSEVTHQGEGHHMTYLESGCLCMLIRMVDTAGGYTLLPQLYESALTPEQRLNIRPLQGAKFFRVISLVIRQDYLRERMVNNIAEAVRLIVPEEIVSPEIKKRIKL